MSIEREIDEDDRRDAIDARRAWVRRTQCQCGNDMPGTCPGPQNCPMVGADDGEEE